MEHLFQYLITSHDQGLTVGQYLKNQGYSSQLINRLKRTEFGLTANGRRIRAIDGLTAGNTLIVRLPEENNSQTIVPTPMELSICYEDHDLLVINKQANVPVHPSQGNFDNTLANGVVSYFQQKQEPFSFRIINRLDRDTTGLLIVAKHALSACILSRMMKEKKIKRTYLAAVLGNPETTFCSHPAAGFTTCLEPCTLDTGHPWYTITAPVSRVHGSTIERQVDFDCGDYACTHFSCLNYRPKLDCSLICLRLDTGRTHQIRVHMNYIGHPLPGDFLYHPDYRLIQRQSLHSWKLDFCHPLSGEPLSFTAPLPEDMKLFQ